MKKRVLLYLPSRGLGGSNIFLAREMKVLIDRDLEVHVVGKASDAFGKKIFGKQGCRCHFSNRLLLALNVAGFDRYNSKLSNAKKVFKDIIKTVYGIFVTLKYNIKVKPDFVIVGDFPLLQVILISRIMNKKVITYCLTSKTDRSIKGWFSNKIVGLSDYVFANTPVLLDEWQLDSKKKKYLPPKFQLTISSESEGFKQYLTGLDIYTRYTVLFIGTMSSIKGVDKFIRYARRMIESRNDVTFLLVGSYNRQYSTSYSSGDSLALEGMTQEVFRYIENHQISETRLKILGRTRYAMDMLKRSDILVSMNAYPHQAGPMFEAMFYKKPVIVSDDKFSQYYIKNGKNGHRLTLGDFKAWCRVTNMYLDNPSLRDHNGLGGHETFNELQSINTDHMINSVFLI